MRKQFYWAKFNRFKSECNGMEETVWVLFKTDKIGEELIEEQEADAYNALWEQYPLWNCPFNSSNPTKTEFDRMRYSWSSVFIREVIPA